MGTRDTATSRAQELRPLLDGLAKNRVDRLYGTDGLPWGTPLSDLEDVTVALRTLPGERLTHHALARQATADRPPALQDFIHALTYVHSGAHAGRGRVEGWRCYV